MSRPRLLDLFCGGGGCSSGYARAGFEVTGVDLAPMPEYPYTFIQGDALEYLAEHGHEYDAIHASPPCKAHTKTGWAIRFGYRDNHPDLLTPTRQLLDKIGKPWIIENVPGAPMRPDVILCGSQFGLGVRRHRWFEVSWDHYQLMPPCDHSRRVASPHGHPRRSGEAAEWAAAMDIDWMTTAQLSQAIPPAYTEYLGRQLIKHLEGAS